MRGPATRPDTSGRGIRMTSATAQLAPHRIGGWRRHRRSATIFVVLSLLVTWAAWQCQVSFGELGRGFIKLGEVAGFFFPPTWSALPDMIEPVMVTLLLAAIATPFGVVLSFCFALAAAKNISPAWLRGPARGVIAVERALPELITLLLLVAALGVGAFPAVLALAIGSVGMLGRLFADAIEEVDLRVLESVECVGASRWQAIRHVVLPEVMPALMASSIYRFEINIRASTLLGAAGAGGIGEELYKAVNMLEYERACVAILVTLALVLVAERCSDFLRRRVLDGGKLA